MRRAGKILVCQTSITVEVKDFQVAQSHSVPKHFGLVEHEGCLIRVRVHSLLQF